MSSSFHAAVAILSAGAVLGGGRTPRRGWGLSVLTLLMLPGLLLSHCECAGGKVQCRICSLPLPVQAFLNLSPPVLLNLV